MSEFKPDWDVKEAALDSLREHMAIARDLKAKNEQLQTTNQQLLSALEWIVSEIKDCAQPEDWESFDACEKAITNAKQVVPDEPTA